MSKVRLKYLELHSGSVLFMKGNLGTKVIPAQKPGMVIERDMADGSVFVHYQGQVIVLERTSVFSWMPENPAEIGLEVVQPKPAETQTIQRNKDLQSEALLQAAQDRAKGFKSAQVSTPGDLTRVQGAPKYKPHPTKPTEPGAP